MYCGFFNHSTPSAVLDWREGLIICVIVALLSCLGRGMIQNNVKEYYCVCPHARVLNSPLVYFFLDNFHLQNIRSNINGYRLSS